ncbi:MAG: hypothetical protein ACREHG_10865 [Candidatus Saccharimonadales bacterium]
MLIAFFKWWYGDGWLSAFGSLARRAKTLNESFSTSTLLRTLFAPWRRIISYPGAGFDAKIRAALDNLFSRAVGFVVRVFVLLAAAVMLIITTLVSLVEMLIWPFLPLCVIAFIVMAVIE